MYYRTDKMKDRYTGAIIGLGPDPYGEGEALLPDHDIELTFDFAFVQEDLVKVCVCLYWKFLRFSPPGLYV